MTRWIKLGVTTPSGKALFVCRYCGTVTPSPTRTCRWAPDSTRVRIGAAGCDELEKEHSLAEAGIISLNAIHRASTLASNIIANPAEATDMVRTDRLSVLAAFYTRLKLLFTKDVLVYLDGAYEDLSQQMRMR